MISHSTPSKIIKIDKHTNKIEYPTILLEKRNGSIIGKISDYTKYNLKLVASGVDEVSFNVHKYVNGKKCSVWDDLSDLKIIELKGYGRFQISVGYADNEQTIKTIFGQSLEVELSQITLENFHINDDEDMDMVKTEYSEHKYDSEGNFIPVTFYNKNNPKRSLLHMVLADKASHWNIGHVPNYVSMSEDAEAELVSEFQRMYTEDSTSIYDFLTGTVAKETNVVFTFDTINRIINCYNLFECEINGVVVNSNDIIGEDTLIFATKRNIAKEINIESNEDQVKNCFRIEGGDDTITAMIAAINMNGTNYIFKVAPWQLADMSEELKNKLIEYQEEMSDQKIKDEYYGENGIYTRLCLAYEELYQKESTLMPNLTSVDPGTAEEQYNKIVDFVSGSDSYIYISKIKDWNSIYYAGITNDVEAYMTILTDSRYTVKIVDDSDSYDDKTHIWKGKIKVTQNTKDTNTYPIDIEKSSYITVKIGDGSTVDGQIEFAKQKLYKSLASSDMQNLKFNLDDSDDVIKSYFNQFSLNRLKSFYDGYNGCLSIIQEYGSNTASDIQKELYDKYFRITSLLRTPSEEDKKKGILGVLDIREQEVESIKKEIKNIELEQSEFQSKHNFYTHLGEDLYKEFCAYRREDTYSNPNYISDNCNTVAEQLEKAKELMDVADTELSKACMLQRTVSASLSNLLVLPEFEKLYDSFALFNYIRIQTDDEVLKLRLIGIEFNGDSIQDINVIFSEQIESINRKISDIESVLNQTQSMITTYPSVVKQAKQGESANKQYIDIHDNGLNATMSMIRNNDNNEITITNSGFLAKRMDDEGFYGDKQLRIVGNGMYLTDDAWKSLKMAVGEIIYINPITGEEEKAYGIIADTIIGNLIAGKQAYIGDENGSVLITGDGITLDGSAIKWKVKIPREAIDGLNEELEKFVKSEFFEQEVEELKAQTDKKAQTWYCSKSEIDKEIATWTTTEIKESHIGDFWYNTEPDSNGNYHTYVYNSSYEWEEMNGLSELLFDSFDGRASIYVQKPSNYKKNDMWVLEVDGTDSNDDYPDYKKGTLLVALNDNEDYSKKDWEEKVRYTDDTKALEALEKAEQGIKDAAKGISLANVAQKTADTANANATNAEKNAKDYADTKDASLSSALTDAYKKYTDSEIYALDTQVGNYLGLGGGTLEGSNYLISPYIGGGYLNITSTDESGKRVIIDPNNLTKNNYIFQIHNGKEISVGIKADGTTNINAHIVAKSLDLITNNVKIPTNNVDGLDSKIKSYGYTTNDLAYKYLLDGKYFLVSGTKLSEITGYDEFANTLVLKSSISSTSKSETITLPSGETVSRTIYTTTVPNSDGTSQVFHTYDDGAYVFTNIGIGKGSSDPSTSSSTDTYVMIDKNGCLTADNAVIRGNIYAIDGYFSGSITASTISGSTFETTNSSGFTKITSGYVNVGKDNTIYGRLDYGTFGSLNGLGLVNLLPNGGYIGLGHTKENKTIIDYWIDSSDFDNISHHFYGNINVDSIYMGNQKCLLSGLSTTESTGGIKCNGVFSTTGKLLVGNTSLSNNSILDVNGSTYINNNLFVNGTTTLKGNISLASGWTVNSTRVYTTSAGQMGSSGSEGIFLVSGETGKDYIHVQDGVDTMFRVDYYGSVYSADGKLSTSDRNKKHDIYTISEKYEKLFEELKPVTYIFNNKIRTHIGYIAQDVEESLKNNNIDTSEFAGYWREQKWKEKDDGNIEYLFDDEGNPIYDCGLRYSEFIALNTHMIQKTRNENKQLKQQIQNQKQEIDSLKESVSILMQQINQGQN